MRGGAGMGQEKSMRGGGEDLILRPRPAPLPSLCPITLVNMTLNKLGQIEYYFWFKFACAQTKSKVKGIINYRNILAFIKMKMLTNDLRALINNLFKENFYGKKKLIF